MRTRLMRYLPSNTNIPARIFLIICFILFGFVITVYLAGLMLWYLHTVTYVWQSTTLANELYPITRTMCLVDNKQIDSVTPHVSPGNKIGVLFLFDDRDGTWNAPLMSRMLQNRQAYCKKYGYIAINANNLIDKSRPPAWSKLLAIEKHLSTGKYDYILYMDMDVVIMNFSISLETFVEASRPEADLIMTEDWGGLNTGIWFARNSSWTKWFLLKAWDQRQLMNKYSKDGIPHPFEYEQRAVHFLSQSRVWKERKLPKYDGNASEIARHIHVLPQCAFNSYSMHPLAWKGSRQVSQYVTGDFLIHFAGKKGQIKANLMDHYLSIAERSIAGLADTTQTSNLRGI